MEPVVGAILAAGVAWASIVTAAVLPVRGLDPRHLQLVGGSSILLLGVTLVGVPLPGWAPLAVLAIGLALATVAGHVRARATVRHPQEPEASA